MNVFSDHCVKFGRRHVSLLSWDDQSGLCICDYKQGSLCIISCDIGGIKEYETEVRESMKRPACKETFANVYSGLLANRGN